MAEKCFEHILKHPAVLNEMTLRETGNIEKVSKYFLMEIFRLFPHVDYSYRNCEEDFTLITDWEQFKFERGDVLHFPIKLLLTCDKYFIRSDIFNPQRFYDEQQFILMENYINAISCPAIKNSFRFLETFISQIIQKLIDEK